MALTRAELEKLLDGADVRYLVPPKRDDAVMIWWQGANGQYQFVIVLDLNGTFLQMRTIGYLNCPAGHKHLTEVLKVLGAVNFQLRLVKLGWDPSDGEIMLYADMWVMDGKVTQEQFTRMLHNFVPTLDACYSRITKTMETGTDPGQGEPDPLRRLREMLEEAARRAGAEGGQASDKDKAKKEREKVTKL